jgi:hypothetical protein
MTGTTWPTDLPNVDWRTVIYIYIYKIKNTNNLKRPDMENLEQSFKLVRFFNS